ncbi:uncharacterized protein CMU_042480 [Cryptosporidium muris RN66]|uniref:Uncharacterized protein n=1 Tax=Cryptosporidium muris (strain RN66) TaxID=441375 RepID=B6AAD4_CRYMR|nr:uncharacterized protein CMU_042480 [Cryptosporidium muris RN66]EEA05175.1 hypothetical protein, conserved [Cryptosporidium muris RN66]|eukprot:XP_002139524.1 hypothetical protein [Cryptosporidium muris RN66]
MINIKNDKLYNMMFNKYVYDPRYFPPFSSQFQQLYNSSYIIHNNLCSPIYLNPQQQLYTCGASQIYSYPNFYQNMVQQQILIEQQKQLIESQIQLQRQLHKLHSATLNEKQTSFSISQIQHDNNATYVVKTSTNNISYEDSIIQCNMINPNINIDTEYRDESEIEVIIRNDDQYVQLEVLGDEDLNDEQISFEPVRSEIVEIILDDNISIHCNELANMKDKKAEEYTKEGIIENNQSVGITVSKVELIEEIIEPISNLYELVNRQQSEFEQNEDSNNECNYNNDIEINNNHNSIINEIKSDNKNYENNKIEENESKLLRNKTCESNNISNNLLYTTSKLINKSNCENTSLDSINQINLLNNNKDIKLSNLNLEDNTYTNINSLNPQDLDTTLTPIENNIKAIKVKDNVKENNFITEIESNNESNIESDWENIWESYYSSKSPNIINDETDSLCYSLLTTSRTDIEQDNLNQNELIDSERYLYKITNKSEKEILFKLSQCRVISSKIMRNSSMNSPIENKSDEINNEVIDFKDISNKLCSKSNNNIFLDEMDLGFRSLINNGLKLDISEMAKPRIIRK